MNTRAVLAAAILVLVPASVSAQSSPFRTETCPVPESVLGYPVWVRAAEGATADSAYLRQLADALARRWAPPSPRRGSFSELSRLRTRIQPPEPRMPDDWSPGERHMARVETTIRRTGRPAAPRVVQASGDRGFDRTLPTALHDGNPAAPELPPLPAGTEELPVVIGFGVAPEPGAAVVRFAAQQTPVQVTTLQVRMPRSRVQLPAGMEPPRAAALVKYDVTEAGTVPSASIEFLDNDGPQVTAAIRDGLAAARFQPAVSNCRPVATSVVQRFGGN